MGPGRPAASERTVHSVRGPGSKGTTSRDLPPQPGLGARGRTQTGCWANALEQGNWPVKGPIPLSQGLVLRGQDLSLGLCLFLSEHRLMFIWWRFTEIL